MAFLSNRFGISRYEADENYHKALEYYNMSNIDQAVLHMNSAITLQPRRAEYYAARGYFKLQDGLADEATTDFEQALQLNPYEVLANYGRGIIAYQNDDYAAAQDAFMKAWAADNNRPETLYYLGIVAHRLRDNAQAHYWMEQASQAYDNTDDREARRRKRNAERWLKTFADLMAQQAARDDT